MSQASSRCTVAGAYPPVAARPRDLESGPFAAVFRRLMDQWRRTAVIRQLNRLSDHHLRDIGIERGEIESVAEDMVKRRREKN